MSKFPLYDNLYKNVDDEDLSLNDKKNFLKRIKKLDENGQELIYTLIRFYEIENNENDKNNNLPYNGIFVDNDINFDLDKFPLKLKQILFKFSKFHLNKMKEEKQIEKQIEKQTCIKKI